MLRLNLTYTFRGRIWVLLFHRENFPPLLASERLFKKACFADDFCRHLPVRLSGSAFLRRAFGRIPHRSTAQPPLMASDFSRYSQGRRT